MQQVPPVKNFQALLDLFRLPIHENWLDDFRKHAFEVILNAAVIFGFLAGTINLLTNLSKGDWFFVLLVAAGYLMVLLIQFGFKQASYPTRAKLFIGIFFVVGILTSATQGTVGDGRIWMLVGALLAAVFLNIRSALVLMTVNIISWFGIWALYALDVIPYPHQHLQLLIEPDNFSLWLNTGFILFSVGLGLIAAIAVLLADLSSSLQESRILTCELKSEIEHRKQMLENLKTSESKYRRLVENSPNMIMEVDKDFCILEANPAMKKSLGFTGKDLVGKDISYIVPGKIGRLRQQKALLALRENRSITYEDQRDDRYFQTTFIPSPDGEKIQVISHDITTLKTVEQELIRYHHHLEELVEDKTRELQTEVKERIRAEKVALSAQKLADLGMLTTGVAHELNSPLQSILTWSELLLHKIQGGHFTDKTADQCTTHLKNIKESVLRCSKIVSSLRYYAHAQPAEYQPHHLPDIIQETLVLIDHQLREKDAIRIETEFDEHLPKLYCLRYQINQLLINLLTNARDAISSQGVIRVQARYNPEKAEFNLEITDNGQGIPEDLQNDIFKPFFTTKPVGEGTGLGLYIVSGIVEAHGGKITVESKVGEGTTFHLTFPEQPPDSPPLSPSIQGRYSDMVG
ncbi:MAG: ATP-binding protein [Anaerolineales bacterium]|nr:ATP-binding protein [Anaerolineales bacterium]